MTDFQATRQVVDHITQIASDDLRQLHAMLREIYKQNSGSALCLAVGIMIASLLNEDRNDSEQLSITVDAINGILRVFGLSWRLVPLG